MILIFCAAAVASVAGTWFARTLALKCGFVSRPNPIVPQHTRPVAYLGGLGVAIGLAMSVAHVPSSLWPPALLFLILGIVDDLRPFRPLHKFLLQCVIAALAVLLGFPILGFLWILTLVNAVNLTDVCDGLVASICVPLFLGLALLNPGLAAIAVAVAGASLGFLVFNKPPATIFLGDAGSHLLGFLAAALSPLSLRLAPSALLIAGVFLFELVFLIIVRTRKGLQWWKGSPDHFALRLQAHGWSKARTVLAAVAAEVLLAAMALVARGMTLVAQLAILVFAGMLGLLAGFLLLRLEKLAR